MKRIALLFGNSNGLSGVKVDLFKYFKFLTSDFGGQWFESEISIVMNPSRKELLYKIQDMKNEKPDYAFVAYSGHGAYSRQTYLEINKSGEFVTESELKGIASRQVSIFDCCRNVTVLPIMDNKSYTGALQAYSHISIRKKYDDRIMSAIIQQVSLYSCSIDESSYETNDGGIYTNCLLSSVNPSSEQYKLISDAQEEARPKTQEEAKRIYSMSQTPDQVLPRCLTCQQLIISINPNYCI